MLLDSHRQCRCQAVKSQEAQGWKDVEENANAKGSKDFNVKRIVCLDQDGPGHGEEEKIEGGAIAGEGWYDEE